MASNRLSEIQAPTGKSRRFWIGALLAILSGLAGAWSLDLFEMSDKDMSARGRGDRDFKGNASMKQQGALSAKKDMAIVNDRWLCSRANKRQQDSVIQRVGRQLGSSYRWVQTEEIRCHKQKERIATFEHVRTGLILNLMCYLQGTFFVI